MVTPRVLHWLAGSRPALVLHLFDDVCNLVDDKGGVISLVHTSIGPGPFSMVLNEDFTAQISAQSAVYVDPLTLKLSVGSLSISVDEAAVWNPKPDWTKLRSQRLAHKAGTETLMEEIKGPLLQLVQAIRKGSEAACRSATNRLAGLGPGLTPAGDDVLMGVLYAMSVWYPDRKLMHHIVDTAVPRTTSLSAAYLRSAGAGEATIQWHNLANGHRGAVDQILAVGGSSGADAWAGFVTAARHLAS